MKKILDTKLGKFVAGSSVVSSAIVLTSSFASASGSGVSASVTSALTTTAGDITSTLGAVAPIGLGIAGTFLAWRYGMKFFKSLSK